MARRAQLVSQHLENISHEALSKYQDVIRNYVRGRQGIYALYRKNELIRYKNKDYNSPSHAGSAVVKRSCNGWTFWKYERAPGDWVFLDELRR
jgi:hypothetical protein